MQKIIESLNNKKSIKNPELYRLLPMPDSGLFCENMPEGN